MYSILLNDESKFLPACIINGNNITVIDTLFDTGAKFTCYLASALDKTLRESDFKRNEFVLVKGFVATEEPMKLYRYTVTQFIVGGIDLGRQTICITFDDRITENVLGMDIISKLTYFQEAGSNLLYLFKDIQEATLFLNKSIIRKCYQVKDNTFFVVIDNVRCYFNRAKIKKDATGYFVMLRNQKCYLEVT